MHGLAVPEQTARTAEEAIERRVRAFSTIGSAGFDQDLDELPRVTAALRLLTVPTVVIHRTEDPMCHPSGGRARAEAIPGACLELITGVGHDRHRGAWPPLISRSRGTPAAPKHPDLSERRLGPNGA